MDKIVILMATYQGEKYLEQQLESILAQDFKNWQLIVRDDGSTDGTLLLLLTYAGRYPERITVLQNESNQGGTKTFLTLLKDAVSADLSTYYMFCDQDDYWHTDKLRLTLARMKRLEARYGSSVPALVFTDACVTDEALAPTAPSFFQSQHFDIKKRTLPHLLMENMVIGCTTMMNAALAGMVKTVPEHARYHDWWAALLAAAFGHTSFLPAATMDYRQHGNNVVGSENFLGYVKRRAVALFSQRDSLRANYEQAEEFLRLYEGELSERAEEQIRKFVEMQHLNAGKRRMCAFGGGYVKSGMIRNIGLFFVL